MTDGTELIAALDTSLEIAGTDVTLRRIVGTLPNTVNVDAPMRASVRSMGNRELASGIAQSVSQVVLSPSDVARAQWPGGGDPNAPLDLSLPKRGDRLVIAGRVREVEAVNPVYVDDTLVRIDLDVLG